MFRVGVTADPSRTSHRFIEQPFPWAQKSVSPTRATLIYAGEPVWAGLVGRIAGERLPGLALLGGLLIVIAVVISELRVRRRPEPADTELPQNERQLKTGL